MASRIPRATTTTNTIGVTHCGLTGVAPAGLTLAAGTLSTAVALSTPGSYSGFCTIGRDFTGRSSHPVTATANFAPAFQSSL